MRVTADYRRGKEVCVAIDDLYKRKGYPFSKPDALPPQKRFLPETIKTDLDLACFHFFICHYLRGGVRSAIVIKNLARMFTDHPEVFDPFFVMNLKREQMVLMLQKYRLGFYRDNSKFWIENARRLVECWDGDPRKIYEKIEAYNEPYKEACRRICNDYKGNGFLGFQEKLCSMLTCFLMIENLIAWFIFPPPVDSHAIRFFIGTGAIKLSLTKPGFVPSKVIKKVAGLIRELTHQICEETGINPAQLNEAVWLFSRHMCSRTPSARTEKSGRRAHGTPVEYLDVNWGKWNHRRAYKESCGCCPEIIEKGCCFTMALSESYNQRRYTLRRREKPPMGLQFRFEEVVGREQESLVE